ncbi:GIY-YIG nuclease family protein [Trichococcus sp. K1Tr]|uniref:GIY-YIG nuclease family protein n=1 Tax=Trichococcus sp. K1Tr TaxID=3020847 RepID=UPI00232D05C3|nr:GIY-YIG nuclease family protein [Trichococcus sp. K1Tr]MDB6354002.1 GIY-YIG nuclease family protein [Trichococcus sp. K1Tr]
MLTESEISWIREVLGDEPFGEISPSYFYRKDLEIERTQNKRRVRKELDSLRKEMPKYAPKDFYELKKKGTSEYLVGIYLIYNYDRDLYYVGKSKNMVNRVYEHFMLNMGSPELHEDYCSGEKFSISLIPLAKTSFSSLDDLEDYAIRAYDSLLPNGYNKIPGNIMVKPIYRNDDHKIISDLILNDIKETEEFFSLSNDKKRRNYIRDLLSELNLPQNWSFISSFMKAIKEYQKDYKKTNKPQ